MTGKSEQPGASATPVMNWQRVSLLWAVQAHAAEISGLHVKLFDAPWNEAAVLALLSHPGSVALVATYGNPVAIGGFAMAQVAADEAEILTIGVSEEWRRHGIGTRLVDGLKRAAARSGAQSLFLEVAESNAAARALYAKSGFTESGRRKGYYARPVGPPEDALVLRSPL